MMRALWTAASGMTSQQLNVDTISNNLSNVNTTSYKKERMEFKSLLYENMKGANLDPANNNKRPISLQIGHGVRPIATARIFDQGNIQATTSNLDFALEGSGFFVVSRGEGDITFTRDGSFKLSVDEAGDYSIVTSEGFYVLDIDDEPLTIPNNVKISTLSVDREGNFTYVDEAGELQDLGIRLNVVQFSNNQGLEAIGANLYKQTPASGEPIREADGDVPILTNVIQSYLERSNVEVAEEMVELIVAQRAYELNSKCIQTADDMLQNANNLKR